MLADALAPVVDKKFFKIWAWGTEESPDSATCAAELTRVRHPELSTIYVYFIGNQVGWACFTTDSTHENSNMI